MSFITSCVSAFRLQQRGVRALAPRAGITSSSAYDLYARTLQLAYTAVWDCRIFKSRIYPNVVHCKELARMSDVPKKRRLLANFNCKPVLRHIRHGSRMSLAPCGMWALQSVLDDMLRRILRLSINDVRVTMRRHAFGQEPPPPYPIVLLYQPGREDPPAPALWKRRKPAVQFYGLVVKHRAPIVQSVDAFGFMSQAGNFWIPPVHNDNADVDDDGCSEEELLEEEIDIVGEILGDSLPGVAVEAIRFVPVLDRSDVGEDDENASGWFWEGEEGELVRYQMIEQAQLEAAFELYQANNSLFQHPLTIAAHPDRQYIVDFQENIQVNLVTQNSRTILRQVRPDISLQDIFVSLNEANRVSGRTVRVLTRYDEPSETCIAKWHEQSTPSNVLAIGHDSFSASFFVHSVVFKEVESTWEFQIVIASSSKLEDASGSVVDASSVHVLMQDMRLQFGRDTFPLVACELSAPVPLPDLPPSTKSGINHAATALGGVAACNIEEMSEEEQFMLALALSSPPHDVASVDSDGFHAEGSGSATVSSNSDIENRSGSVLAADAASHSMLLPDLAPAPPELKDAVAKFSGICCSLRFSIPFDSCASLPQAFAKVNLCVGNQVALLGTVEFEAHACDEEDRGPSHAEEGVASIIVESFRMIDDHGEFSDEPVDIALLPEFVGANSFIDHVLVDNAVKKILSQELLVSQARHSLKRTCLVLKTLFLGTLQSRNEGGVKVIRFKLHR